MGLMPALSRFSKREHTFEAESDRTGDGDHPRHHDGARGASLGIALRIGSLRPDARIGFEPSH
jgi:hypothetical protein